MFKIKLTHVLYCKPKIAFIEVSITDYLNEITANDSNLANVM